ncbi:MAG: hypothetical protein OXG65_07600 [Chloroflexi bacterium]|nr:hypothetical protein [Chloroflexota bacterium]
MTEVVERAEEGREQEGEERDRGGHLGRVAGYSRIVYTMSTTLVKRVSIAAVRLVRYVLSRGDG